jgi:glycyl-tRNA synthetase beta chain
MPSDLLFEIGVEEIPASFVLPALEQLKQGITEGLSKLHLEYGEVQTYGTPRRLAILLKDVADRQPDMEQEYKGPPADRAFDAEGHPTKAAEGFARTRGVAVEDLQVRDTDKGSWVFVAVCEPGQPAAEVLPELLSEVTLGLSFPKTMRWADLDQRFARPIRWLVALLGSQVVNVTVAGVAASDATRGHRVLGSSAVQLDSPSAYVDALRANYVLADQDERREAIRTSAQAAAAEVGGNARIDEDLLTEVSFLVEWPTCLWGAFDAKYLTLPEPVIVTVMRGHQRYFPVENGDGRLLPYFITVRNGTDEGIEIVRAGNEKVIVPRLADAEFYLNEDLKHSLDDRAASLARVTFMEGMGTLADKTARLEKLVAHLAEACPTFDAEVAKTATRAAHLSKADLVTLMVGDSKLGELQGVIGGEYALRQGEPEDVATAIAEQYRPRGAGDEVPASLAGTLVSLADKLDNLAACFRLGAIPSGSADPFALRRQAQGIVEMLLGGSLHLNLREALLYALNLLPEPKLEKAKEAAKVLAPEAALDALMGFFAQRLDFVLTRDGVTYDLARAALGADWDDAREAYERAQYLQQLRTSAPALFDTLVTAAERPARITRPEQLPEGLLVNESLFQEDGEPKLWATSQEVRRGVASSLSSTPRDYAMAVNELATLAEPIHEFFAQVMVMVDDEPVRNNRLALLREIDRTFLGVADFLQVVREGQ